MGINYSYKLDVTNIEALNNLTSSVGWGTRSKEVWKNIINISSYVIIAKDNDKIVGMGRIVSDSVMCMVYDIAVLPEYQNQGIATHIMEEIVSEIKKHDFCSIGLFAWDKHPHLKKFYSKFGFTEVSSGMQLK